jgi:hypothetical protein
MIARWAVRVPERPDLILGHQARIACHVSREDGCQPPLDLFLWTHGTLGAVPDEILLWAG